MLARLNSTQFTPQAGRAQYSILTVVVDWAKDVELADKAAVRLKEVFWLGGVGLMSVGKRGSGVVTGAGPGASATKLEPKTDVEEGAAAAAEESDTARLRPANRRVGFYD